MKRRKEFTRYTAIKFVLAILGLIIFVRLTDMQIINGKAYLATSDDHSIRTVASDAPRGNILDRNNILLAGNVQRYAVFMTKPQTSQESKDLTVVIERLVNILNRDNEKINDSFNINVEQDKDGKYSFHFDFPNNYTDQTEYQNYVDKAAKQWLKYNSLDEGYTAEQAFYALKERYNIQSESKEHDTIPFIRQIMAVRQMIKDQGYMAYQPVRIAYVSQDTAFEIMERGLYLPGVDTKVVPLRTYPFGQLASVVVGGLRKIPTDKTQEYKDKHYDVNTDLIGRNGIEAYAEDELRGESGERTVRVDSLGRVTQELSTTNPIPGNNVVLTIDKNLQQVAENSLDTVMEKIRTGNGFKKSPDATRGAAVVIDVKNGEILAMASRPGGFDPNVMAGSGSITEEQRKVLYPQNSEHPGTLPERIIKPMFNYATAGAVPPGSTFKMVSAVTGLETGKINPHEIVVDRGKYTVVNGFSGGCWLWNEFGRVHGPVDLARAIRVSCNYYFFEVGRRVGLDNLTKYAKMFGLTNEPTGIEIYENPGDVANKESIKATAEILVTRSVLSDITKPDFDKNAGTFVPTDDQKNLITEMIKNNDRDGSKLKTAGISSYKMRRRILDGVIQVYNEYNKPGIPLNTAIGQGDNRFTPLQIASYIATLANGGTRYRPHLVKAIAKPDGTILEETQPEILDKLNLKPSTIEAVKAGMYGVVEEGGTAAAAFRGFPIVTAGKTGTAQASGGMTPYSWFSGFAPADNPQIAVAVVIYEGGGVGAANVAREIYNQYFQLNSSALAPSAAPSAPSTASQTVPPSAQQTAPQAGVQ